MVVVGLVETEGGLEGPVVVEGHAGEGLLVGRLEGPVVVEGLVEAEGLREGPVVGEGLVVVVEGLVEGLATCQRATTATVPSCLRARSARPCSSTVTNQECEHPPPISTPAAVSSLAGASPTSVGGSCGPHGQQTLIQCGSGDLQEASGLQGLPGAPWGLPEAPPGAPQGARKAPQDTSKRPPRGICIQAALDPRSQPVLLGAPRPTALSPSPQAQRNARSE